VTEEIKSVSLNPKRIYSKSDWTGEGKLC